MNNNELRCYKHHDRVLYDTCDKCKKFLCKECAQKYPSGLCDECEKKRIEQLPMEKEKEEKERIRQKNNAIIQDICIIPPCMIIGFLVSFTLMKDLSLAFVSTGVIIGYLFAGWIIGFKKVKKDIYIDYHLTPKDYSDVALHNMLPKEVSGLLPVFKDGEFLQPRVSKQRLEIFLCIFIGFFLGIILIPIRLIQGLNILFKKYKKQ